MSRTGNIFNRVSYKNIRNINAFVSADTRHDTFYDRSPNRFYFLTKNGDMVNSHGFEARSLSSNYGRNSNPDFDDMSVDKDECYTFKEISDDNRNIYNSFIYSSTNLVDIIISKFTMEFNPS